MVSNEWRPMTAHHYFHLQNLCLLGTVPNLLHHPEYNFQCAAVSWNRVILVIRSLHSDAHQTSQTLSIVLMEDPNYIFYVIDRIDWNQGIRGYIWRNGNSRRSIERFHFHHASSYSSFSHQLHDQEPDSSGFDQCHVQLVKWTYVSLLSPFSFWSRLVRYS